MEHLTRRMWCGLIGLVILATLHVPVTAQTNPESDMALESIVARYRALLMDASAPAAKQIDELLAGLTDDHRWSDIDYGHDQRTNWQPAHHAARLARLARAWAAAEAGENQARADELAEALNGALRYWVERGPTSPNWWHNEIGVPGDLLRAIALARPPLDDALVEAVADSILARELKTGGTHTGQNLIWRARNQLLAAALVDNTDRAAEAARRIAGEIVITTDEGVQPDFSFHQHGAQLYNGGYGSAFANDTATLGYIVDASGLALPDDKKTILADFLIEGQQWMMHRTEMSPSTGGREIARPEGRQPRRTGPYLRSANLLAEMAPERAEDLRLFARRQQPNAEHAEPTPPLVGGRHFYRSDFTVHHRPDWMVSIKSVSDRMQRTESGNGENLKGTHLDDGLTFLLREGDEYKGVQPTWNWKRLPGTTAVQDGHLPTWNWSAPRGETAFVGGATDGMYTVAAYDLKRTFEDYTIAARKAWFLFDGQYLALGAGIRSDAPAPVATTIEQNHLTGPVRFLRADGKAMAEADGLDEPREVGRLVEHDDVQYEVLDGRAMLAAGERQGSWRAINNAYSDEPVRQGVFALWIDHGTKPRDARYAYRVTVEAAMQRESVRRQYAPAVVLENTPALQAAAQPKRGIVQAVFYEAGSLAGDDTRPTIAVDQPCLVMLRRTDAGRELTVAGPTQKHAKIRVTIGDASHVVELPTDDHAGRSVTIGLD